MSKKQRIAELERRVAELEARPVVYPSVNVPNVWIDSPCATCGYYGAHACLIKWDTTTNSSSAAEPFSYIGAN